LSFNFDFEDDLEEHFCGHDYYSDDENLDDIYDSYNEYKDSYEVKMDNLFDVVFVKDNKFVLMEDIDMLDVNSAKHWVKMGLTDRIAKEMRDFLEKRSVEMEFDSDDEHEKTIDDLFGIRDIKKHFLPRWYSFTF
jgi:hypothetical protein